MEINVRIEDSGNDAALRSLLAWLETDDYIKMNSQPQMRGSARGQMNSDHPEIELVLTAGFKIAHLAMKLLEWVKEDRSAAPIVITPPNQVPRTVSYADSDHQALRALVGAPDPRESTCLLIGVSDYTTLGKLPQVQNDLIAVRNVLSDPAIWGIPPARLKILGHPRSADEIRDAVSEAAHGASETLLVYFAGHGLHDQDKGLLLALPDAGREGDDHTVPWSELARVIGDAKAQRKIVLLDCCYSGLASSTRSRTEPDRKDPSELSRAAQAPDTFVLAAALEKAAAPHEDECTAFTDELVRVLRNGIEPGRPTEEFVSLNSIHREVRIGLRRQGFPEPVRDDPGHIGAHPQFHNALAYSTTPSEQPQPVAPTPDVTPGRRRFRTRDVVAAGAVAAIVLLAFLVYWFVPGDTVSGLDLARRCSTLTPGGAQTLAVARTTCARPIDLDAACRFSYQNDDIRSRRPTPDAYSAECINPSTSQSYGGVQNMDGFCASETRAPGVTATPTNPLYSNTWVCQVDLDLDIACRAQNNRGDVVAVEEENKALACRHAHLF